MIKSFLSLVCLFGVMSVHAQEPTKRPVKNLQGTKPVKVTTDKDKMADGKKTTAEKGTVSTAPKKEATPAKTKMKQVKRPVKK